MVFPFTWSKNWCCGWAASSFALLGYSYNVRLHLWYNLVYHTQALRGWIQSETRVHVGDTEESKLKAATYWKHATSKSQTDCSYQKYLITVTSGGLQLFFWPVQLLDNGDTQNTNLTIKAVLAKWISISIAQVGERSSVYNQDFSFCEKDLHILFKLLLDHTLMIKHKLPYYSVYTSLALKITALALLFAGWNIGTYTLAQWNLASV